MHHPQDLPRILRHAPHKFGRTHAHTSYDPIVKGADRDARYQLPIRRNVVSASGSTNTVPLKGDRFPHEPDNPPLSL